MSATDPFRWKPKMRNIEKYSNECSDWPLNIYLADQYAGPGVIEPNYPLKTIRLIQTCTAGSTEYDLAFKDSHV